jgi:hypothetical protein
MATDDNNNDDENKVDDDSDTNQDDSNDDGDNDHDNRFSYDSFVNYMHSKVIECRESEQDMDNILSRDWKSRLAASLMPHGMELNEEFIQTLYKHLHQQVFEKLGEEVEADERIVRVGSDTLKSVLRTRAASLADQRGSKLFGLLG